MSRENLGITLTKKVIVALSMMACDISVDLVDDHSTMDESQAIKCVKRFSMEIVEVFG
jgi:hypothetical protein